MGGLVLPERKLFRSLGKAVRVTPLPTFREFAESKIILPDGPYAGLRLKISRQPYLGHLLNAYDNPAYNRFAFTGPVQSGKTLGMLIPLCYHLFEIAETVVFGVPTDDIAAEKWTKDILPIIQAQPSFAALLPKRGPGSKNASNPSMVTFRNGATLKFMTGRGRDESRSHFTTRVVMMSEVDKMDKSSKASRESDPVRQLEGRTGAYGKDARIYMECSPTVTRGRIWVEYNSGTASVIALNCPHCKNTRPYSREHFKGWETAKSTTEAEERGRFHCPACDRPWSKQDRLLANQNSVLLHRGQHIVKKSKIVGDPPNCTTFGLNWNAPQNMFIDDQTLAAKEFIAANDANDLDESGEKDVLQQRWGMPYEPPQAEFKQAKVGDITARMPAKDRGLVKGIVAPETEKITIGTDIGKYRLHYVAMSKDNQGRRHIFDYDIVDVLSDKMKEEDAIVKALTEMWEAIVRRGVPSTDGVTWEYANWAIDVGYMTIDAGYPFLQRVPPEVAVGAMGFGYDQLPGSVYRPSGERHRKLIGLDSTYWEVIHVPDFDVWRCNFDADHFKMMVQRGLTLPVATPRSLTLYYKQNPKEHIPLAKQLASESLEQEFVPGKGWQSRHVQRHWQNHYLDAAALAWLAMDISDTAESAALQTEPGPDDPEVTLHPVIGDRNNGQEENHS